jgi:hypothetical protein
VKSARKPFHQELSILKLANTVNITLKKFIWEVLLASCIGAARKY